MNSYQQTPQNINISPYQQNIDIVKGFFKKPIVLAYAVVSALVSLFTLTSSIFYFISMSDFSYYYLSDYYSSVSFSLSISIISFAFNALLVISWLIIHFSSKNSADNKTPLVGIKIVWVCSIISLVASALCSAFLLLILFLVIVGSFLDSLYLNDFENSGAFYGSIALFSTVIAIFAVFVIVFLLIYTITNLIFISSVKKSLTSIYLKSTGAKAFGVVNIILFSFLCVCIVFYAVGIITYLLNPSQLISDYNFQHTVVGLSDIVIVALSSAILVTGALQLLLMGLIALKYSSYIKNIKKGNNKSFSANNTYANPVVPGPVMSNDYPQNQEFNPYNPAPTSPTNENSYANPYENSQPLSPQEPQPPVPQNSVDNSQPTSAPVEPATPVEPSTEAPIPTASASEGVCPNCGSSVFRSDMFCNNCGTKLK